MIQVALHAELAICDVLSDGRPRSRSELAKDAKALYWEVRWIPGAFTDALASLVAKDMVSIEKGRFCRKKTAMLRQPSAAAAVADDDTEA
jgi:hypothetical protein